MAVCSKIVVFLSCNDFGKFSEIIFDFCFVFNEFFRLLKCGLQETYNLSAVSEAKSNLIRKFFDFIKIFVQKWNEQQAEQERHQKEAESLYKIK